MSFPLPVAFGFALTLFRVAGLFLAAPLIGTAFVPARVRLALALAVATAVFLGAGAPAAPLPPHLLGLGLLAAAETATGLAAGLAARLVLEAAQAGGTLAAHAMGLSYGAMVDPFQGVQSAAPGQLLGAVAMGSALALELPAESVAFLAHSLAQAPPGSGADWVGLARGVIAAAGASVSLACRIAFPFLAMGILTHLGLGLLGRAAPQINLYTIGFALSLLGGLLALYVVGPAAAQLAARAAIASLSSG